VGSNGCRTAADAIGCTPLQGVILKGSSLQNKACIILTNTAEVLYTEQPIQIQHTETDTQVQTRSHELFL